MTDLERYILDEWTEDYREGHVGRREFLRRVVVFSGGAAAGVSTLASLGIPASAEEVAAAAAAPVPPQGGTGKFTDSAQAATVLFQTPPAQHVAVLNAGVRYLQGSPSVRADRVGTMGFCFGGGMVWRLATHNPDLRAAVPFYGPNP